MRASFARNGTHIIVGVGVAMSTTLMLVAQNMHVRILLALFQKETLYGMPIKIAAHSALWTITVVAQ
jgi:hypothetical protein